jgi:ferritin-like metal-binding protein YciE
LLLDVVLELGGTALAQKRLDGCQYYPASPAHEFSGQDLATPLSGEGRHVLQPRLPAPNQKPGLRAGTWTARQGLKATSPMMERPVSVKTMNDLFVTTLKDIYYAEKQILKALPTMVKKANGQELKDALDAHRKETERQVERLDQAFKMLDVPARGKKCEAIEGIIDEAKEHMEEIKDERVLDASMISSAQAVEHYEICRYGTLIEWAKDLGLDDAVPLLQQNLEEEKNADKLLSKIARSSSNQKAMAAE